VDDGIQGLQTSGQTGSEGLGQRLNSWKEIAAFFGKDERTVKRWETIRGLPVRRVPGGTRTSVFAYVSELEAWLSAPRPVAASPTDTSSTTFSRQLFLPVAAALAILGLLLIGLIATVLAPSRLDTVPSIPAEAQALYDDGVLAWTSRTTAGFATAIEKFDAALAIAPDYARAEVGLANVYNLISQYTLAPAAESYAKAKAAAERAIALDPNLAEAYAALGFNAFYGTREFGRSAELFESHSR
jgi:tetratricopeptide (TPR) repeat protein